MARKRGFFAELQYQQQLAEKQRLQAQRSQARDYARAVREAELAQQRAERATTAALRASLADQKAAEKEAKRLHLEAQAAEVEALNSQLVEAADELGSILEATLSVDDYVDLEQLRATAEHPPFTRGDLERPTPDVVPIPAPAEPVFKEPEAPSGLGGLFGKRKHVAATAEAREAFEVEHARWQAEVAAVPERQLAQMQESDRLEQRRLQGLQAARDAYQQECNAREGEVAEANARLDALIAGLAIGEHSAVQEYVGIVLSNSVYPEVLEVEHDFEFDPVERELTLTVLVAPPERLPSEKSFRHVKASDEIVATALPKKDLKARCLSVVEQVAIRSLHEIFEADRAGRVQTIALRVATETADPATGMQQRVVFAAVAADRESFTSFDLHNVVAGATLAHLGAAVSKNPYDLVGIDDAPGVRGR